LSVPEVGGTIPRTPTYKRKPLEPSIFPPSKAHINAHKQRPSKVGITKPLLSAASTQFRRGFTGRGPRACRIQKRQAYAPELNKRCRPHLKPINKSYRTDETEHVAELFGNTPDSGYPYVHEGLLPKPGRTSWNFRRYGQKQSTPNCYRSFAVAAP
jgi:hypothetical protein